MIFLSVLLLIKSSASSLSSLPKFYLISSKRCFPLALGFLKGTQPQDACSKREIFFVFYLTDPEFLLISHFHFSSSTDLCSNCASYTTYLFLFAYSSVSQSEVSTVFSLSLINEKLCISLQTDCVSFGQSLLPLIFLVS